MNDTQVNGTYQYFVTQDHLRGLLDLAKDILYQDLKAFNGEPMEEAVALKLTRSNMTKRIFYKTKIIVDVLSEEPYEPNYDITTNGSNGIRWEIAETMELNGAEAARELLAQGSDPECFRIDEDGNDILHEGDEVDVEKEDGTMWSGTIVGFKEDLVQVEDQEGDVWDCELKEVSLSQ